MGTGYRVERSGSMQSRSSRLVRLVKLLGNRDQGKGTNIWQALPNTLLVTNLLLAQEQCE